MGRDAFRYLSFLGRQTPPQALKLWDTRIVRYRFGLVDGIRWYAHRTWARTGEPSPVVDALKNRGVDQPREESSLTVSRVCTLRS